MTILSDTYNKMTDKELHCVFDEFEVDTRHIKVCRQGCPLELEPRVYQLLIYFCQHPGRPISRDELIEQVWDQRIVSHAAVNRAVSELRKIIDHDPALDKRIQTISKVGYQFNVTPQPCPSPATVTSSTDSPKSSSALLRRRRLRITVALALVTLILLWLNHLPQPTSRTETAEIVTEQVERPLTALKGASFNARFSADGQRMVFLHKTATDSYAQVWSRDSKGRTAAITTDDYYYTQAIFASEQQLYATRFNNLHARDCEIVAIALPSRQVTPLFTCARRALTRLALDRQRQILYFNYRQAPNAPFAVYAYQLASQRLQQISTPHQGGNTRGDYLFALSPDNQQLAVLEYQADSRSRLKIISLTGQQTVARHLAFKKPHSLVWQDNHTLLVATDQGLRQYQPATRQLQQLNTDSLLGHTTVNPASGAITFDKGRSTTNLFRYPLIAQTAAAPQSLTTSSFGNYTPAYANTTDKLAYVSTDPGTLTIMIRNPDGATRATRFDGVIHSIANLHWSPDDKILIAGINGKLYRYHETSALWQALLPEHNAVHYVHYANNDTILFSSEQSGDWQIWAMTTATGKSRQLTQAGGYSVQGDPAQGHIYYTKFNQPGLFQLELATGDERPLLHDLPITSWRHWQIRQRQLYYIENTTLHRYQLGQAQTQAITAATGQLPAVFSISHDQQWLARATRESQDINIWELTTIAPDPQG